MHPTQYGFIIIITIINCHRGIPFFLTLYSIFWSKKRSEKHLSPLGRITDTHCSFSLPILSYFSQGVRVTSLMGYRKVFVKVCGPSEQSLCRKGGPSTARHGSLARAHLIGSTIELSISSWCRSWTIDLFVFVFSLLYEIEP